MVGQFGPAPAQARIATAPPTADGRPYAHERIAAHLERPVGEHLGMARALRRAVRLAVEEARLEPAPR